MFFHPLIAPTNEGPNRGRRGIENAHRILFDNSPEAVRLRPIRRAFIHDDSRSGRERAIDDITVAGDPADICRAPVDVALAQIENIFRGRIYSDEISSGGVKDPFGFPSRSTGVENVKRMFAVERRRWAFRIDILELAMPPDVAA